MASFPRASDTRRIFIDSVDRAGVHIVQASMTHTALLLRIGCTPDSCSITIYDDTRQRITILKGLEFPRQTLDRYRRQSTRMNRRRSVDLIYFRIYCRPAFALSTGRVGRLHRSVQVLTRTLRAGFVSNTFAVPQSCTLPSVLTALTVGSLDGAPIEPSIMESFVSAVKSSCSFERSLGL
jgi:hypothetical protein